MSAHNSKTSKGEKSFFSPTPLFDRGVKDLLDLGCWEPCDKALSTKHPRSPLSGVTQSPLSNTNPNKPLHALKIPDRLNCYVLSGAKQIFSSTLPHSDNCAWEGFFTCSLRVVSVWAHSMQLNSFTTKSLQIFSLEWKYNICCDLHTRITVTCWQSGWAPHDFCHRFIVSHNEYVHKYMYLQSLLETCSQKNVQLVTGVL